MKVDFAARRLESLAMIICTDLVHFIISSREGRISVLIEIKCSHDRYLWLGAKPSPAPPFYRPGCLETQKYEIDSQHPHFLHLMILNSSYFFPKLPSYFCNHPFNNNTEFLASPTVTLMLDGSHFGLKFVVTERVKTKNRGSKGNFSISLYCPTASDSFLWKKCLVGNRLLLDLAHACFSISFVILISFFFPSYTSVLLFPLHDFSWENITQTSIHTDKT